jgi:trimethyllysine dioxygenase
MELPFVWLRDYCQCKDCQHPETKQRIFNTFAIPEVLEAKSITISPAGKSLIIKWQDDHLSEYSSEFLEGLRSDPESLNIKHNLWKGDTFKNAPPYVDYEQFMTDEKAVHQFLEMIEEFGFAFVEGTPPTGEATKEVSERICQLRGTIFGSGYYEMTANLEHKDTAYTPLPIEPHTDGTYSNDAPSYQVLHCIEENCQGGTNILVDGFMLAKVIKEKYPHDYYTLTNVQVPGQYIDTERGIHLMARRPIFRLNDSDSVVQVSFNNHDRAPFVISPEQMQDFYRAIQTFARLYSLPEFQYRRKLLPGSCLFFDNWRILHAREAYTGYRKLGGVYFNKEDVESRLRTLRQKYA